MLIRFRHELLINFVHCDPFGVGLFVLVLICDVYLIGIEVTMLRSTFSYTVGKMLT